MVCKLQDERVEGDYCHIVLYEHATTSNRPKLHNYIKSYCEVHDKVAHIEKNGNVFPDIADAKCGDRMKYRKQPEKEDLINSELLQIGAFYAVGLEMDCNQQFAESARLEAVIRENLSKLGYDL